MSGKVLSVKPMEKELGNLTQPPIFVNDLPLETEEDRQFLRSLSINTYKTTDVASTIPRCLCGHTTSAHRLHRNCVKCGFEVRHPNKGEIESNLWVRAPQQIGKLPTNVLWIFCEYVLKSNNFSGLAWITDPYHPIPEHRSGIKAKKILERFNRLGIPRGLKSFYDNFDLIASEVILKTITDVHRRADMQAFFEAYRDQIFTTALPLPAKIAMVVEETSVGKYYDKTIDAAIEAVYTAAETAKEVNLGRLESRFTKVMANLSKFSQDSVMNILLKKKGFLRRACYGMRMKMAFRNVITSQHDPHDYRGVGVPYHQLLTVMAPFVRVRLINQYNMTYTQAYDYVEKHQKDCDPLLWRILEDFIDESPEDTRPPCPDIPCKLKTRKVRKGRGIAITGVRFPSLDRGSTEPAFVQYITKDTVEISVLCLVSRNADRHLLLN